MKFYALVAVDHQYRLVGLTPSLSCIASASGGREAKSSTEPSLLRRSCRHVFYETRRGS